MLLPKGGVNWKATRARLPPSRAIWSYLTRTRLLLYVALAGICLFVLRGLSGKAEEVQKFYCWGPSKPPSRMSPSEQAEWHAHLQTPVVFNHHAPVEINSSEIQIVDLNKIKSSPQAAIYEERVLILTPMRDASRYLQQYFDLLTQLTYPHHLIDLGFLVGDTKDETLAVLANELERIQKSTDPRIPFHSARIVQKDFGASLGQNEVKDRHAFVNQAPRRKSLARARNYLLSTALQPNHSWVYWRDVDIQDSPSKIIEDFVARDKDVLVPNIWFHRYEEKDGVKRDIEGRFDYNSWQETDDSRKFLKTITDPDLVLAEGYKEYPTKREYMAKMGDWRDDPDVEIPLDGIGGVNIIVKADVHRSGINFPCYPFEHQAETEGFAKMAKRAGYGVYGLPNYVVWHIDTEEEPGNA